MKIAVDARILALPQLRGMAAYLLALLREWPSPLDEFFFLSEELPDTWKERLGNRVCWQPVPSPRGSRLHIWDWWALPRAVKGLSVDLFWSPANLAFPLTGITQVVTVHDTLLQERVVFKEPLDHAYYRYWMPWALRRYAQKVITVSHFSAQRIRRVFRFPRHHLHVVHNGVHPIGPPPLAAEDLLMGMGLEKRRYIYGLGAQSPWKNTLGLVRAFARAKKELPGICLVISGIQDRFMARVRQACQDLNLGSDTVCLLGYVDADTRDSLYAKAALFVYPSLFEGFGLPPLEAMSWGTPVVASRAASIPEVVGNAALLTDASDAGCLADAMIRALKEKDLKHRMVLAGPKTVCRFDWKTAAQKHRRIMAEAVK